MLRDNVMLRDRNNLTQAIVLPIPPLFDLYCVSFPINQSINIRVFDGSVMMSQQTQTQLRFTFQA